jgi:hypothetical protein
MAENSRKSNKQGEFRRLNRAVGAGEALGKALDPVFRRRGFASRDLVAQWAAMAPPPYDTLAQPDRLHWPRGARGTEGAVLYLRCAEGQALALAHEGPRIAAAINRYFGYVLVGAVRISPEPLKTAAAPAPAPAVASPKDAARIAEATGGVADEGLRAALSRLGAALANRRSQD